MIGDCHHGYVVLTSALRFGGRLPAVPEVPSPRGVTPTMHPPGGFA